MYNKQSLCTKNLHTYRLTLSKSTKGFLKWDLVCLHYLLLIPYPEIVSQSHVNPPLCSHKLSKFNEYDRFEPGYPDKRDVQSKLPAKLPFQH